MGIGTIVIALASIIIGEVAFGELTLGQRLVAVTLGSILYRLILLAVLQLGFSANDLNLLSAIVLALCMMIPQIDRILNIKKPILKGLPPMTKPILELKTSPRLSTAAPPAKPRSSRGLT